MNIALRDQSVGGVAVRSPGHGLDLVLFRIRRLGAVGAIGVVLCIGALLAQQWQISAAQTRLENLRAELNALRNAAASKTAQPTHHTLDDFYDRLKWPPQNQGIAAATRSPLSTVHALARESGVRLDRGEYRTRRESSGKIIRYQYALPVTATYPALRSWLAKVLDAMPGAAIESLSLKRDDVGDETIEAQLRLVVYVKAD